MALQQSLLLRVVRRLVLDKSILALDKVTQLKQGGWRASAKPTLLPNAAAEKRDE
jgi:hypothetical protein